jgi:protein-arginine kinase activator protein McsA
METITIISAIASLVTIIVFFIMAYDINQIKREINSYNLRFFLQKTNEKLKILVPEEKINQEKPLDNVACPKCGFKFPKYKDLKKIHCSFCNIDFEVSEEKK